MKKLLSILGSLTLASSSAIVVASCGPKDNDPSETPEEKNDYLTLISEFKKEVEKIMHEHFSKQEVKENLVAFSEDTENLDFFNKENIIKYGKSEDAASVLEDKITPEIENKIFSNLSSVLVLSELESKINSLGTETGKYNIILDSKFLDKNTYLSGSTSIKYTTNSYEGAAVDDNWLLSSTSMTIRTIVKYKDQDLEVKTHEISVPIVFIWGTDQVLVRKVQKIQNDVLKDYYNEDTFSWLDMNTTDLGYTKETSYEMFELFDEKNRTDKFNKVYKSKEFQEGFIEFIGKKYLNEAPFNTLKVNFKESKDEDYNYTNTLLDKIKNSSNTVDFTFLNNNSEEYASARQDILTELKENGDIVKFKDYGDKAKNDTIYNILNNDSKMGLSKQFGTYKNSFDEFNKKNGYEGEFSNSNSFMHGTVSIDDLQITINDKFELPFNPFDIAYSVSVDKKEESTENVEGSMVEKTSLGNAVYYNTVKGIQSFQNVFNTKAPTITNGTGNNEFLTPIAFVGKNDSLAKNIWDYLPTDKATNPGAWNDVLSLNIDDLISHRNLLLDKGYQNDFDLHIINYWKEGKNDSPWPWLGSKDSYIYTDIYKNDDGLKLDLNTQRSGSKERFMSIKLEINFVRLIFAISQSDRSVQSSYMIEKAN